MFNNIFCEMKGEKVICWGGLGEWGNRPNCLLEAKFRYLLGYPSNNHAFMPFTGSLWIGSFYLFNFLYHNHSWKVTFAALKSPLLLQSSTYRHSTGFIVKRKQVRITNYLGLPINFCFKVAYFSQQKIHAFQKMP